MKKGICIAVALVLFVSSGFSAAAYEPYKNYTFKKSDDSAQEEPPAYLPQQIIDGKSLGTEDMNEPSDIYVAEDMKIYVCDSGNNRILILNPDFSLHKIIKEFDNNGVADTFQTPSGVFVSASKKIYIADTENERIVVLNQDGSLADIFGKPESNLIDELNFSYRPVKLAVDFAERIFVISQNENNGIIELGKNGEFWGYFGAVRTTKSISDLFSLAFTKEQKERKQKNVPVEYNNVNVDDAGFVYGTVASFNVNGTLDKDIFLRKMNPLGTDVLKRNGFFPIMGDINYEYENDNPALAQICDVALREGGMYSILGRNSGRVYTYDNNGNLLYIFGGMGNSFGQFLLPVAFDCMGDQYLVLDRNLGQIITFVPTRYGSLLSAAALDYYNMDYAAAEEKYEEILRYTVKSDIAYDGMANALLRKGDIDGAMKYFKLSENRDGYSEAYQIKRSEFLDRHFLEIIATLSVLIVAMSIAVHIRRKRKEKKNEG